MSISQFGEMEGDGGNSMAQAKSPEFQSEEQVEIRIEDSPISSELMITENGKDPPVGTYYIGEWREIEIKKIHKRRGKILFFGNI